MTVANHLVRQPKRNLRRRYARRLLQALVGLLIFQSSVLAVPGEVEAEKFVEQLQELHANRPAQGSPSPQDRTNAVILRRQTLLHAARNAAEANRQATAIERYKQLVDEFPEDDESRYEFAGRLIQWDQWELAHHQLVQLVRHQPQEFRFRELLADVLIQQEQLSTATEILQAALEFAKLPAEAAIKLARVLAWQQDYQRASDVLEQHVGYLEDLPPELRKELALCWIEMRKSAQAIDVIDHALQQFPGDRQWTVLSIRAQADLGHRRGAEVAINQLDAFDDTLEGWRVELADALYRERHYRLALQVYRQVHQRNVRDYVVGAKIVRTQCWLYDLPGAEQTLVSLDAYSSEQPVQEATANYLVVVGDHTAATRLYDELLAAKPNDVDVRNGRGHLYYSIGDYLRAESEYRKALALAPSSLKTVRFVAKAQVLSRQYQAAVELLRSESSTLPRRLALCQTLVEVLFKARRYPQAEAECLWGIANTHDPRVIAALRTELGWIHIKQGQQLEAENHFRTAQSYPGGDTPKAAYGLYKALQKQRRIREARGSLEEAIDRWPATLVERMALADLATAECCCDFAARVLQPCYQAQPDNLFLVNRLGEAASQCDRRRGTCRDRRYFKQVLQQAPNNTRARLGLARSYARTRCSAKSIQSYQAILCELPEHRLAQAEQSRVVYGACGVDAGVGAFDHAQQQMALARNEPTASEALRYPVQVAISERFDSAALLQQPTAMVTDNSANAADKAVAEAQIVQLDQDSMDYEQSLLSLEREAKCRKPWRPRASLAKYRPLLASDRINEEGYFDLGQVYGQLNSTCCAAATFSNLLAVNPCHTEAAIARSRACLEMGDQAHSRVRVFDQQGRDGLAEITRVRLESVGQLALGDEDEFLTAGYAHDFLTTDRGVVNGDIALLGAQWKPWEYTRLFTNLEIAGYDSGLETRPLFQAGVSHRTCRDVAWQLYGFMDNVLENGQSIATDVYRTGLGVSMSRALNWRWTVGAGYRWSHYSDDNDSHDFAWTSNYLHWYGEGRRQLRSIVDFQYLGYRNQTVFGPTAGDLAGTIHPYFSPNAFGMFSAGLEWKHWLSCHNFKYSNERWYSVYGGGRVDTEGIGYGLLRARCQRDLRNWISYGVESSFIFSEVYESTNVAAYLTLRFG